MAVIIDLEKLSLTDAYREVKTSSSEEVKIESKEEVKTSSSEDVKTVISSHINKEVYIPFFPTRYHTGVTSMFLYYNPPVDKSTWWKFRYKKGFKRSGNVPAVLFVVDWRSGR